MRRVPSARSEIFTPCASPATYTDVPGMGHPHNDYLRQAHDYGVIGLGLWVWGMVALAVRMVRNARRPYALDDPLSLVHVSAALALFGAAYVVSRWRRLRQR